MDIIEVRSKDGGIKLIDQIYKMQCDRCGMTFDAPAGMSQGFPAWGSLCLKIAVGADQWSYRCSCDLCDACTEQLMSWLGGKEDEND